MSSTPQKLPSGSWRCIAYLGKNADGKRIRKSFTAAKKSEARRLADEAEDAAARAAPTKLDGTDTFGEGIDKLLQLRGSVLSPTTVAAYKKIKRNYLLQLLPMRICDLTDVTIQAAVTAEAEKHAAKTVVNAYGALAAVLALYRPKYAPNVILPQIMQQEIVIPDQATVNALIDAADARGDKDLALAIMLGAQLGLRRSEICALTLSDVAGGVVRINKAVVIDADRKWQIKPPKTKAGTRTLSQTEPIRQRIEQLHGAPGDPVIRLTPDVITKRFGRLQQALKIKSFRFHDLRHFNCSVMLSLGIPMIYITSRLGHASDAMVRRVYGHLMGDKLQDVNAQMSAFFGP